MKKVCPVMLLGKNAVQIKNEVVPGSYKHEYSCLGEMCAAFRRNGIEEWCGLAGRLSNDMQQELARNKFAKANHSEQQRQTLGDASAAQRGRSGAEDSRSDGEGGAPEPED